MWFVADSMLGKLAKWLRVLGYDTHYQGYYGPGVIAQLVKDNRLLLSRHNETVNRYLGTLLIMHGTNILLNWILIFGNFGFPALGN